MTTRIHLSSELRLVTGSESELIASGSGVLEISDGIWSPQIRVLRDGRSHSLPFDTAIALFGSEAVKAMLNAAEDES